MKFEFDPHKSETNLAKHGIDFRTAQAIWLHPVVELAARDADEPRRLVIGQLGGVFWSAIIVRRADTVRIISVRRSREDEKAIHRSTFKDQR